MKKLKFILLFALLISTICITTAFAAQSDAPTKGIQFLPEQKFDSGAIDFTMPQTFEYTVYFPADTNPALRGGIVYGSYINAASSNTDPCMNIEVMTYGNPRLFITDNNKNNYNILFDKVNVYQGKWVHVAITVDSANNLWKCYVDGVLAQTIEKAAPAPISYTKEQFRLGGDFRTGNATYFKGYLKNITFYKDIRTDAEISSDAKATKADTSDLSAYYDFSECDINNPPKLVKGVDIICPAFNLTVPKNDAEVWLETTKPLKDYAYSFAVIGDTQTLTRHYPDKLTTLYDWIVKNKKDHKMEFVIGLGDITDGNSNGEWEKATTEIKKLNGLVPYSLVRGNHDSVDQYNKYITYDVFGNQTKDSGSFDGTMLNTYQKFTVGKVKYLIINFDLIASNKMLEWASKLISDNPDYNVILTTHIYMYKGGSTYPLESLSSKYGSENNGDTIWEKLISKHENIVMLICGHNPTDDIFITTKRGEKGNKVTKILVDPQSTDLTYGGLGMVAMFYFSEDGNDLQIRYYSTVKERFFKAKNQITLELDTIIEKAEETKQPETTHPTTKAEVKTDPAVFVIIGAVAVVVLAVVAVIVIKNKKK